MTEKPATRKKKPLVPKVALATAHEEAQLVAEFAANLNKALDHAAYPAPTQQRAIRLAQEFGVTPAAARKWLNGTGMPSPGILKRMAATVNFSLDWLFGLTVKARSPVGMNTDGIPVYYINNLAHKRIDRVYAGDDFEKRDYVTTASRHGLAEGIHFIIQCWQRVRDPDLICRRGRGFLCFDARVRSIYENHYYLLRRHDGTIFLALTRLAIDGTLLVGYGDSAEMPRFPEQHFTFNNSLSFEEPPPTSPGKLRVLGRLVSVIAQL